MSKKTDLLRKGRLAAYMGLLAITGCGRLPSDPEPTPEEWLVGEVFEGAFDVAVAENGHVRWFEILSDGTWRTGIRYCDATYATSGEGTWVELENGDVELQIGDGSEWDGGLGGPFVDVLVFKRGTTCDDLELEVYYMESGLAQTLGYARGTACLESCDGSGTTRRVACGPNPCAE